MPNLSDPSVAALLLSVVAMCTLGFRVVAYGIRMVGWHLNEKRKASLPPEQAAALSPPPEIPDAVGKVMMLALFLSGIAVLAIVMRPRDDVQAQAAIPPSEIAAFCAAIDRGPELQLQACTDKKQCGSGCACKEGQCRCPVFESPTSRQAPDMGAPAPAKREPTSSLAATTALPMMAGEASFEGSL